MDCRIIVVGTSLGGFQALGTLLGHLNKPLPPIVIAKHRGPESDQLLVELLNERSRLPVSEPVDKEVIERDHVYIAPPDYHLLVEEGHFSLSVAARVSHARPSIDVLFESAAETYAQHTIGLLLTGANSDGAYGMKAVKERGGLTIVQQPDTAESRTLPDAAIALTRIDQVMPIDDIAPYLMRLTPAETRIGL